MKLEETMEKRQIDPDSLAATFGWKLPGYILGVIFGYIVVEVAMALFGA